MFLRVKAAFCVQPQIFPLHVLGELRRRKEMRIEIVGNFRVRKQEDKRYLIRSPRESAERPNRISSANGPVLNQLR